MIKSIGYILFSIMYNIYKLLPIKSNSVMCIMTHDDGPGSNVALVAKKLALTGEGYSFSYINKSDMLEVKGISDLSKIVTFFFLKSYQLACAEIVLMDNIFLPFAYITRRKATKVIQLWHGTGTIKKFGQDFNQGKLKELERSANQNITHLIVSGPQMVSLYAGAFGIKESCIYPIGLPKTDELIGRMQKSATGNDNLDKVDIYRKYQIPLDYKLILYAPTFRDLQEGNPDISKELEELLASLPNGYYLGLRLHPHVAKQYKPKKENEYLKQMSFEGDINTLLMATDILITDYSSIIFEFALLNRPIIFYAYDLEAFSDHGRGFYKPYHEYVPGPVVTTGKEAMEWISGNCWDEERIRKFRETHFVNLDANGVERLVTLLKDN